MDDRTADGEDTASRGAPGAFPPGGGETSALVRTLDWSRTPIGPPERWSPTLRTVVSLMMANRFPMILWWGPRFIQFYNDAYVPIPGRKHPRSMGQPASECWPEIWHVIGPLIETPFRGGPPTWMEDIFLELHRHGFLEETHFTIAYSPVPDETAPGGIGGVLATVHEITGTVVGDRRVVALRDLGARSAEARTADEACALAAQTLARHDRDVPFALLYLVEDDRRRARLAGAAGISDGHPSAPASIALDDPAALWPLATVLRSEAARAVPDLGTRLGRVPPGPWVDPPDTALVVPIRSTKAHRLAGFLVAGVSARLKLDGAYRDFLELVASQVATAIANARDYEEEKRRAEALAELDRAKTTFFSNVSHELRTPLTLILGPLEDLLSAASGANGALRPVRPQLDVMRRAAVRLLKLVNTLLDFARIEAGRVQASYEPTDLAALTTELASVFRSAVERAGLSLVVRCPPIAGPAFVDREMWEKIVLNLLSNALKFTFEGEIEVALAQAEDRIRLSVRDTGVGICEDELPRVFDRFHRVRGARARTHEGTGIGLALVSELARLHGGTIAAESADGRGSTFTVTVPAGSAHLPADRIGAIRAGASTSLGAAPFLDEAMSWLRDVGDAGGAEEPSPVPDAIRPDLLPHAAAGETGATERVLVADDNADLLEYLRRLVGARWPVEAVRDGAEALASARARPPALVLADVMMPGLDGFALLHELRAGTATADVPVILLSARAGEEARIEGLAAGADDYLTKPFSARELVARVQAHLDLHRVRKEADRRKDEFLAMLSHELRNPLAPIRNSLYVLGHAAAGGPQARRAQEVIERQVGHLTRLVDDLLDVTRINRGKIRLRRAPLELGDLVRRSLDDHRASLEVCQLALEERIAPEPLPVEADPTRIAQVVDNLLGNAAKFTPPGGTVTVTVARDGQSAALSVRDTGVGIAPEILPHLFQPFAQAPQTLDRTRGGLGLGLALVKGLVELHGGSVAATPGGAGGGAEFVVRLPLAAGDRRERPPEPARPVRRRRILVVEDSVDGAETLREVLELMGHEVRVAHDGVAGIVLARAWRPEVVLCDIGLPGTDGHGVARALRADDGLRGTLLVALTGYAMPEDLQRAAAAGFQRHLAKPPSVEALEDVLADGERGSPLGPEAASAPA